MQENISPSIQKSNKAKPLPKNDTEWKIEDQRLDDLVLESQKNFLLDIERSPTPPPGIKEMGFVPEQIALIKEPEKLMDLAERHRVSHIIKKAEWEILDAYDEILDLFKEGYRPIITLQPDYLESLTQGIKASSLNTYDGRRKIVGTIGKKALNLNQRVVCEIDVGPDEILPRSTGKTDNFDFAFNGVVFFANEIDPKNIKIIQIPPDSELPIKQDDLPITAEELKNKL